jgi:hypothetical protein
MGSKPKLAQSTEKWDFMNSSFLFIIYSIQVFKHKNNLSLYFHIMEIIGMANDG